MDLRRFKTYDHADKLSRDIHFTIDHNGNWYFHGSDNPGPMKREALVKLFADKALKMEDERYFLKTPFESYEVDVEDVPFLITSYQEQDGNMILSSNIGDSVMLNKDHKLYLKVPPFVDIHLPYIQMENGMAARLNQDVREDFIDRALQDDPELHEAETLYLIINGVSHPIAVWEEW